MDSVGIGRCKRALGQGAQVVQGCSAGHLADPARYGTHRCRIGGGVDSGQPLPRQEVVVDPPASALRIDERDVARLIRGPVAAFVALASDGSLVGACLWSPEDDGPGRGRHLSRLAVAPSWRRRGVARRLVAAIVARARDDGYGFLTLSTRLALESNRALFRSLGFDEIPPPYPSWLYEADLRRDAALFSATRITGGRESSRFLFAASLLAGPA